MVKANGLSGVLTARLGLGGWEGIRGPRSSFLPLRNPSGTPPSGAETDDPSAHVSAPKKRSSSPRPKHLLGWRKRSRFSSRATKGRRRVTVLQPSAEAPTPGHSSVCPQCRGVVVDGHRGSLRLALSGGERGVPVPSLSVPLRGPCHAAFSRGQRGRGQEVLHGLGLP